MRLQISCLVCWMTEKHPSLLLRLISEGRASMAVSIAAADGGASLLLVL